MFDLLRRAGLGPREVKHAPLALSTIRTTGVFEGYASLFGIADLGHDIVMPGAFRQSLARRGAQKVKLLWQHQAGEPIGSWLSLQEDARGLHVIGKLNLHVARAREILSLMREGSVDGLSIGFRAKRVQRDPATGLRHLLEVDLWEISLVTFPMLPQARVSAVKSGAQPLLQATRLAWQRSAKDFAQKIETLSP